MSKSRKHSPGIVSNKVTELLRRTVHRIQIKEAVKSRFAKLTIFVTLIAVILRFYNYNNRWGLAYDQAQFAIVARYALATFQLPLLGPFSSGGPFQTGGEWYWIVTLGTLLNPFSVMAPWFFITLIAVFCVPLMIYVGKELDDKIFGLVVGILTAISVSQVAQSTNLTNQTPIVIFSIISILCMVKYFKTRKTSYLFFQALVVSSASAVHIQAIALMPLVFFTFIFAGFPWKKMPAIALGLIVPWIPVFIADSQNNFYNTINMFTYFGNSQSQTSFDVLGRRWLTFAGIFVPKSWAYIIGGYPPLGYVAIVGAGIAFLVTFLEGRLKKEWWVLALSTVAMLVIVRYTRAPLFDSFLIFLHPFILLFTAVFITFFIKKVKFIGYGLLALFIVGSIIVGWNQIKNATNFTAQDAKAWEGVLRKKYPNDKFAIYDFALDHKAKSLPLVLYLSTHRKTNDDGRKIGVFVFYDKSKEEYVHHRTIYGQKGGYQMLDLSASSSAELQKAGWAPVNPSYIYNSVEKWFGKKP